MLTVIFVQWADLCKMVKKGQSPQKLMMFSAMGIGVSGKDLLPTLRNNVSVRASHPDFKGALTSPLCIRPSRE